MFNLESDVKHFLKETQVELACAKKEKEKKKIFGLYKALGPALKGYFTQKALDFLLQIIKEDIL